ncbi:hypothetical protein [Motilibacter deserti]|uniref:Uncharacterized protein n=1 Tax=Motilibacter deserti TaxID=2714956 RepID=A0ABX0GZ53_9ACTN|nr:hypothetical protein [Motilibacter deserti]NHC16087.1 hypothetical protein [Motilibacter deserti]
MRTQHQRGRAPLGRTPSGTPGSWRLEDFWPGRRGHAFDEACPGRSTFPCRLRG